MKKFLAAIVLVLVLTGCKFEDPVKKGVEDYMARPTETPITVQCYNESCTLNSLNATK